MSTLPCKVNAWSDVAFDDVQVASQQLSMLYGSGLGLLPALTLMENHSESPVLTEMFHFINLRIAGGQSLSGALRNFPKVFSPVFVGLVEAGEESGHLDEMLRRINQLLEQQNQLKKRIQKILIYPVAVLTVALTGGWATLVFVVPRISEIFESLALKIPAPVQLALALSSIVRNPACLVVTALALGLSYHYLWPWLKRQRRINPDIDVLIQDLPLRTPVVGPLFLRFVGSRLLLALSVLLGAGLTAPRALYLCSKITGNVVLAEQLKKTIAMLETGATLSTALTACEALPNSAINVVRAGEEAGSNIPELMNLVGSLQQQDAENDLQLLASLVEPAVLLIVTAVVLLVITCTLYPLVSILQQL